MQAFPKIFSIGTDYIRNIFKNDVECTEKADGSQFSWGKIYGELYIRSKGKQMFVDNPEKMFQAGVDHVCSIAHLLPENVMFHNEYLRAPKHNVLTYGRIPKNHHLLFGMMKFPEQIFVDNHDVLSEWAERLGIEVIPLLYRGNVSTPEFLRGLLERESVLGGVKIEGVVVKNYQEKFLLGGQPMPLMAGKYVSEAFKEVHREKWGKEHTGKGKWDTFKESFCTEARWAKAVQHLEERGELLHAPQDIGRLMKEVNQDILDEEEQTIKDFLWKEFGKEVLRTAARGLPEWYKQQLLERSL